MKDEIVEEVRRIREAYGEQFDFDLSLICRDLRERELSSGREYVTLPPRPSVSGTPNEISPGTTLPVPASRES